MDNRRIRINNLKSLIDGFRTLKEFAEFADMDPSHVSQIKNGHIGMGTSVARKIEFKFNKQKGWIDIPHGQQEDPEIYSIESHADPINLQNDDGIPPETLQRLMTIIHKGIGMDRFETYPQPDQTRIIRVLQKALLDAEISGLSDKSILKMVDLNDGPDRQAADRHT